VTALHNVGSIDEVFGDTAPRDKPSLIGVDQVGDEVPEPESEAFGMDFKATVLERDGSEVVRLVGPFFFRKEDNVGLVDGPKVRSESVEAGEGIEESRADHVPVPLEESRSKAIRPWTRVVIHSKKGSPDLFEGERSGQGRSLRRCEGGGGN
jgi:hypothetical protein